VPRRGLLIGVTDAAQQRLSVRFSYELQTQRQAVVGLPARHR
jgi:hypothetical protein